MLLCLAGAASAYIDPGTGGYIVSGIGPAIWAAILAALGFIGAVFRRVIIEKAKKNKAATVIIILLVAIIFYLLFFQPAPPAESGGLLDTSAPSASEGGGAASQKVEVTGASLQPDPSLTFDASVSGAHMIDASKAYNGYNLYEGKLIDMQGNIVHNWSRIYLGVIDQQGNYYAQKYYEADTFGKYTWDDRVIWEKKIPIHHQILLNSGKLYTMTKEVHMYNGRDVEFDVILVLNATNGAELSRYSLWDHLAELQGYHKKLELDQPEGVAIPESSRMNKSIWGGHYDYYHLNYLQILPENALSGKYAAFQKGNWMISFRHGSMVFILDKDTKKVVWRAIYDQVEDRLEGQHSPQMLSNGRILIMDNGRYRNWSRVIEIDPLTLKVLWEFKAPWFYSLSQGQAHRLPNGNTLVIEGEDGHVFEITHDGEIVWEFYNPDTQGPNNSVVEDKWGTRQEIYNMDRYPKAYIDRILQAHSAS
jgi:hypothetical protein